MRRLAAVAIAVAAVMVMASVEHDALVMMPMSVTDADANSDAADTDLDAFRDDHWFVAGVQRAGKCRQRQKRNKNKAEQNILHDGTLFGWGQSTSRYPSECALDNVESV